MSALWNYIPANLRPDFPGKVLSRSAWRTPPVTADKKFRATSYMDGIRGLSAFLVVIHHWVDMDFVHWTSSHGYYNYEDPSKDRQLLKLPIIRLLFNGGHTMVPIFFVISGFSLAYKPVEYIRAKKFDKLLINLSSSLIRRAPRLCIPPVVMTMFVFIAIRLGWYDNRPLPQPSVEHFPSIFTQLLDWYKDVSYLPDPFSWDFVIWVKYQPHTWTLNTELQGSKWVYLTILATCTLSQKPRLVVLCWWCCYCIYHIQYWTFLFCSGIVIAELHHMTAATDDRSRRNDALYRPLGSTEQDETLLADLDDAPKASKTLLGESEVMTMWILLLVGLFLCSAPYDEPQSKFMFWRTLWRLSFVPRDTLGASEHDFNEKTQRVYMSIGSVLTVFAISRLPVLRRFFNLPVMQYLGHISFSLYLIHGPVIMTLGWAILPLFWSWFGVGTYYPPVHWDGNSPSAIYEGASRTMIEVAHFMCLACMLPVMFWGADLFTRFVDLPVLRWTKSLYAQASSSSSSSSSAAAAN